MFNIKRKHNQADSTLAALPLTEKIHKILWRRERCDVKTYVTCASCLLDDATVHLSFASTFLLSSTLSLLLFLYFSFILYQYLFYFHFLNFLTSFRLYFFRFFLFSSSFFPPSNLAAIPPLFLPLMSFLLPLVTSLSFTLIIDVNFLFLILN